MSSPVTLADGSSAKACLMQCSAAKQLHHRSSINATLEVIQKKRTWKPEVLNDPLETTLHEIKLIGLFCLGYVSTLAEAWLG